MKPILKISNGYFSYGSHEILRNVNFEVSKGDFIAIIGPNGGGKTTLLKIVAGFLRLDFGILLKEELGLEIAYVPQAAVYDAQFPISVLEIVLMGRLFNLPWYGKFKQQDIDLAYQALAKVRLKDLAKTPFGELSGGQKQRVLLARALVSEPKLLLLDEPTASVDYQSQKEIYQILEELKGKITILMVTHDLKTALNNVDKVFCVQSEIIEFKPNEVCEHFTMGLYHPPLKGVSV